MLVNPPSEKKLLRSYFDNDAEQKISFKFSISLSGFEDLSSDIKSHLKSLMFAIE